MYYTEKEILLALAMDAQQYHETLVYEIKAGAYDSLLAASEAAK